MTEVVLSFDVSVPCRDGAVLKCNIARPAGEGHWPVLVGRTPYGKDGPKPDPMLDLVGLAREGFVVLLQDVRERFRSRGEGQFLPFVNEGTDGVDLIAWAAAQPFSTGEVFAIGSSYMAFAQWAVAVHDPAALRAIAPGQSPSTPGRTLLRRGGVFEQGAMDVLSMAFGLDPSRFERIAAGEETDASVLDALVEAQAYEQITVPALISAGWYDFFCQGAIDQFVGMRARAGSVRARQCTRLIMGPWTHTSQSAINGERYFGMRAAATAVGRGGLRAETLHFFLEQLTDTDSQGAPVTIFVMGENIWREEGEWPLARTQWVPWYLGGHGTLGPEANAAPPDSFIYDPANPVPTWGGSNLGFTELAGARDQRPIESRGDVLSYTSEALTTAIEVTGAVVVELWAASSAPDTDFVARLVDVEPDGTAFNLAEGILRARYRHDPEKTGTGIPLEPGTPNLFCIELSPTSNRFQVGHRLRLDITSSCHPRWARNLNVWEQRGATLAQAQVAHQSVLHDADHPSRVILPIIPPS